MKEYFIDSTVPMYWAGKKSRFKKPCVRILEDIAAGKINAFTSAEVFQEIIYRFMYIKEIKKGLLMYDNFLKTGVEVLPITRNTLSYIRSLAEKYSALPPRDIFHASVMIENNIKTVITADKDFDKLTEIKRIDPLDY